MFSSPRIYTKGPNSGINLVQTQKELINSLEANLKTISVQNFYQQTSLNFPERSRPNKKLYASDLLQQIEEKQKKSIKEKQDDQITSMVQKNPLDFPVTPNELRRNLKKEKQLKVKKDLESQIDSKNWQKYKEKYKKAEKEKKEILEFMKKFRDDEKEKQENLKKEKMMLMESWNSQVRVKDLQVQVISLENKGFNPRARSVLNRKQELVSPVVDVDDAEEKVKDGNLGMNLDIDEKNEVKMENGQKVEIKPNKKLSYLEKTGLIKDRIEEKYKNSVQWKIKKIIDEVRENRKINSNSMSPTRFAAYRKMEIRN